MSSQLVLLHQRRFLPLFATQFLGAFNDNLFKSALIVLLTFHTAEWTTLRPEILTNIAQGLFMLPFFLFSATAGQLADKYDKAWLARLVKMMELLIMLIALAGLVLNNIYILLFDIFLLGLHSTVFGPIKYAILPQVLNEEELVGGNALIESSTFVAILLGMIVGNFLTELKGGAQWVGYAGILVALAGLCTSWLIPRVRPPVPDLKIHLNPLVETLRNITYARRSRAVFLAILGISWFWLFGLLFIVQLSTYVKNILGGESSGYTLLLFAFTVGIGIGSMVCERLSGKFVEIGLVPIGSFGMTLFALDLYFASPQTLPSGELLQWVALLTVPNTWRILFDLTFIGIFGGVFIIPLYAMIQLYSEEEYRARIIATSNVMGALFMMAGSVVVAALVWAGMPVPVLFALIALCNALVAIYIYTLVPEFVFRFLDWLLVHTIYRLRVKGTEHMREQGPVLLVCNNVSLVDIMVVAAMCRQPIRFVVAPNLFKIPVLSFILREMQAIALHRNADGAFDFAVTNEAVVMALQTGHRVCIFPECRPTRDGEIAPFEYDIRPILDQIEVPVIPVALSGLWGSFFSYKEGNALRKLYYGLRCPIDLTVGERLDIHSVGTEILRENVRKLRGEIA